MRHAGTGSGTAMRLRTTALLALIVLTAMLGTPAQAAAAAGDGDTTIRIRAFPPAVLIAAANDEETDAAPSRDSGVLRFDSDEDFETLSERMPWLIGLIFLAVGSIFLTPIVLLVGIIWYKLRKARLQNEAMLALAEKGIVPAAQAADALAAGASPASVAPPAYQQAIALRKHAVWSDLRKGVILSTLGLALSFYELTSAGGPSWIGLVLLFVGAGYVALWWLEGRHLDQARSGSGESGQAGTSGS